MSAVFGRLPLEVDRRRRSSSSSAPSQTNRRVVFAADESAWPRAAVLTRSAGGVGIPRPDGRRCFCLVLLMFGRRNKVSAAVAAAVRAEPVRGWLCGKTAAGWAGTAPRWPPLRDEGSSDEITEPTWSQLCCRAKDSLLYITRSFQGDYSASVSHLLSGSGTIRLDYRLHLRTAANASAADDVQVLVRRALRTQLL